jgi:hypothetical protein
MICPRHSPLATCANMHRAVGDVDGRDRNITYYILGCRSDSGEDPSEFHFGAVIFNGRSIGYER